MAFENSIWVPKPFSKNQSCVKIPYLGFEISIAVDDSCGAFDKLCRSDLRIYANNGQGNDVIAEIMGNPNQYYVDVPMIKLVFQKIEEHCKKTGE